MTGKRYSTGLELVLCACERELLCVLTDDEELVFSCVWGLQDRASELLAPTLQQAFSLSGHRFAELRRIGCVRGPGSFTGIRLVLATAHALRRSTKARLAALDYLQALATTLAMQENLLFGRRIWVMTHARRELVHLAGYTSYGPTIPAVCTHAVELVSPDRALEILASGAGREAGEVLVAGSALVRQQGLRERVDALCGVSSRPVHAPSIGALRLLGRHGDYFDRDVEPLYVRSCDAVDNLPDLARRMGQDGEEAVNKLTNLLERTVRDEGTNRPI